MYPTPPHHILDDNQATWGYAIGGSRDIAVITVNVRLLSHCFTVDVVARAIQSNSREKPTVNEQPNKGHGIHVMVYSFPRHNLNVNVNFHSAPVKVHTLLTYLQATCMIQKEHTLNYP